MRPKYSTRLRELCAQFNVPYEVMIGPSKKVKTSKHRRHLILMMSQEFPELSTPRLGKLFNRDHSTIIVSRQKALTERANGEAPWLLLPLPLDP